MVNNVKSKFDLYPWMCKWLETYLNDKFKNKKCDIIVVECHSVYSYSVDGLGSLKKVLNNLKMEDILDYGSERRIKKIKVARLDIAKDCVDNH